MENQTEINKWGNETSSGVKKIASNIKESAKDSLGKEMKVMSKAFDNMKHKGTDLEHEVEERLSSFFSEGLGHDAIEFSKKAVKNIRASSTATTAIAVVGGVAVGFLLKRALYDAPKTNSHRE